MKKKLLSLALVFVMALTLLPTAAFAAEELDEHTAGAPVCAQLEGCVDGQHDLRCPLNPNYTAPAPKTEPEPIPEPEPKLITEPAPEPKDEKEPEPVAAAPKAEPKLVTELESELEDETEPEPTPEPKPAAAPASTASAPADGNTALPGADGEEKDVGQPEQPKAKEGNDDLIAPNADTNPHTLARKFEAVDATCTTTGKIEYYTCATCTKIFSDEALTTEITTGVTTPALGHNYVNGYCTRCQAKDPDTTHTHTHAPVLVSEKPATCTEAGVRTHYACVCGKYYSAADVTNPNTIEYTRDQIVIPAKGHTRPTTGVTAISSTQHAYTCAVCGAENVPENHIPDATGKCTVCGFQGGVTPSSYVSISSAYVNSYSISVTWYSDLPYGTYFDICVDGVFQTTVAPARSSSGYFSYTVDFSHYLGDRYYDVMVRLSSSPSVSDTERVYSRYYDHDYDYWYDHYYPNSTPSTNSSGIPYASQVNGRYSAAEAIRILRNSNHSSLQYDLLNSNSASNSFYDLEQAVKRANNVSVQVDIDRGDVPSAIRNIQIVGAAFNASSTNSTVRLVVDAPSRGRYSGYGYAFSMSLTGVGNDSSLDVPVKITMPVPSSINANSVRILHYHNSNVPTVIEPKVSGSSMSFTLTGFSDFVVTDNRVDPYYYYYTPGVPASARRNIMQEHLAVVLPILASMPPSGYIFDDVSAGHWAAAEIAWARDGGMMSGYYDGTFRPYAATTRQELWMVLARLAGARPADMWAAREWAINAGISDGRNPHSTLSVQQMITMLYRYAQYLGVDVSAQASLRGYRDNGAISGYARNAMAWAVDQGILAGDGDNCLNPQNIATRADFAVYLYRFIY